MTIDQMRDALAEARRYARTNPRAALDLVEPVLIELDGRRFAEKLRGRWDRLADNLGVAMTAIHCDPEAFTSACYLVSHELLCIKGAE